MSDLPDLQTWLNVLSQERQLLAYLLVHRHAPPRRDAPEFNAWAGLATERLQSLVEQGLLQEREGLLLLTPGLYAWLSDRLGLARPRPASALTAGQEALVQALATYRAALDSPLLSRAREQLWQALCLLPHTLRSCEAYLLDLAHQSVDPALPASLLGHLQAAWESGRQALLLACEALLALLDNDPFPRTEPAAYWAPAWQALQAQAASLRDRLQQLPTTPAHDRVAKLQRLAYLQSQQELLLRTNLEALLAEESALVWGPRLNWQPRPDLQAGWPAGAWHLHDQQLRRPALADPAEADPAPDLQPWLQAARLQDLDLLGFLLQQSDLPLPPEVLYFELLHQFPDAWEVKETFRSYQGWEYAEVYPQG